MVINCGESRSRTRLRWLTATRNNRYTNSPNNVFYFQLVLLQHQKHTNPIHWCQLSIRIDFNHYNDLLTSLLLYAMNLSSIVKLARNTNGIEPIIYDLQSRCSIDFSAPPLNYVFHYCCGFIVVTILLFLGSVLPFN